MKISVAILTVGSSFMLNACKGARAPEKSNKGSGVYQGDADQAGDLEKSEFLGKSLTIKKLTHFTKLKIYVIFLA